MPHLPLASTATELLPSLRSGALSAEALVRSCLQRIADRDGDLRAWVTVRPDYALKQAREADRRLAAREPLGALHGLPVGIKDVIATAELPTQHNSPLHQGAQPGVDAACVALLRAAGAIILGKTDTVEFAATGRRAATRNPHDLARTPGGSSSGSAAAVADGHVPLALATQTGGSTIRPAAFCGVWALKPTHGLVSNEGCKRYAPTLDTLGWMARSAADLALLLDVFDAEPAPALAAPFSLAGARIAVCHTPMWPRAEAATRRALAHAERALRHAGAQVQPLELPPPFGTLAALQLRVMRSEGQVSLFNEYRQHGERLEASLRDQVLNTDRATRAQLCRAWDTAAHCRQQFDALASGFDAVLTPSTPGVAPLGLLNTGDLVFNGIWTLLHVPCVQVPGWWDRTGSPDGRGLPVGLTLTGPRFTDRQVLAVAEALGQSLNCQADPL
jgi:Asp-tRNA(Asn)/Glu-tRNA(Gln) amidotransferase A subunit family amidase